jgi:MarR family transcriptional regulator, organic hydroperoxide resistance regulator
MGTKNDSEKEVYDLMWEVRKFTRSSLILQNVIAQHNGLNVTDAECLDFLLEMGSSTAGGLAKVTGLTTGAITNVIDRLEMAGFVKRSLDPNDRRKVIVSYVSEKHSGVKEYYQSLANEVQQLFLNYDTNELKFLIKHTQALNEIYNDQVAKVENTKKHDLLKK